MHDGVGYKEVGEADWPPPRHKPCWLDKRSKAGTESEQFRS